MAGGFTAAAVQMHSYEGQEARNLERLLERAGEAASAGARLIVFPEASNSGYFFEDRAEAHRMATPIPGPFTEALGRKAIEVGAPPDPPRAPGVPEGASRSISCGVGEATRTVPRSGRCAMRRCVSLTAGILLALTLGGVGPAPAAAATKDRVTLALNFVPYGIHTPFFVAQERGFYEQANLDVTIERGAGSAEAVAKVGAGAADVGFADAGAVVVGRAKGARVTLVAMLMDKGLATIYTYRGSGITKPKDLEGRTVADNAGGGAGILFPALAAIHGVDTSKVNIVMVAPAAKNPTLIERKADAIFTFSTIEPNLKALAAARGTEIVGLYYSDLGLDLYGMGLFASEKMLRERRDVVRRWTEATMRAVAWSVEHPDEAVALFIKRNQAVSLDLARGHWHILMDHLLTPLAREDGIGHMTEEKMRRTRDVLVKYQKLEGDIPLQDLYSNAFLPKLFPRRPAP